MKPEDLTKVWDAPDHSKLSVKQFSIRLPILANAKIFALCEMYPARSKTTIINDLIATALDQVTETLPGKKGKLLGPDTDDLFDDPELRDYTDSDFTNSTVGGIYEDVGIKGQFLRLTKKYLRQLEKEANIKEPTYCPDPVIYAKEGEK
ncbi:hypothetical protein [Desulfobacula sp.]|uniref:hypothetical protein n=1 Tax=Desulfobacula sp. TaxID=2593537 RepID=UPI0026255CED|nr:hypothetical protein [Desulfobacula sp.]